MTTEPNNSRLGRGLDSMTKEVSGIKAGSRPTGSGFMRIPIANILRSQYQRSADNELCESIKKLGVLQPILVVQEENRFKLLAGSRRLEAASKAGLADIPALVIPPDRAGPLDVFLDENLHRAELSDEERSILRDQWMKETGRDEEQAEGRIPPHRAEPARGAAPTFTDPNKIWRYATVAACLISLVLLIILVKPSETMESNQMDEAVASILAGEPAATDPAGTAWMDDFLFPGNLRVANESRLTIFYAKPAFQEGAVMTPRARVFFYQLAAVALSSAIEPKIEITGFGDEEIEENDRYALGLERAAAAANLLFHEGIPESRVIIRGSTQRPVDRQTLRVSISPSRE